MQLLNLQVDRIIIHQIFQRDVDGNKVPPTQGFEYVRFDQDAMNAFKKRVSDALGEGSRAVSMDIVEQGVGNLPMIVSSILDQDDDTFAGSSFDVARLLTNAQQSKAIPGGIVVVFSGTQGPKQTKYLGIIKAEVHSGYEKANNDQGEITLKFVEELLLTPGTRLYKTAGFFQKADANAESTDLNDQCDVPLRM